MKAPAFAYCRPRDLDEALDVLDRHGGDARPLAGGQSLLPVLHLRLAAPAVLVDLQDVAALRGIARGEGGVRLGAMTTYHEALADPLLAEAAPLLALALPHVAHPAIRHRGTLGGSASLADPAAEVPAVCTALSARFELRSRRHGTRTVAAEDFFQGAFSTALDPGELLTAIVLPDPAPAERVAFDELARRRGDYAVVGTCVRLAGGPDRVDDATVVQFGVADRALRLPRAAAALCGRRLDRGTIDDACAALLDELQCEGDLHTAAATKHHLAGVQLRRLLTSLLAR
jgi:carbon-monoxide dehydrogenase medium subunit